MEELEKRKSAGSEVSEELSILDLLITLLKHKWLIITTVFLAVGVTAASLFLSEEKGTYVTSNKELKNQEFYYSECMVHLYADKKEVIHAILRRPGSSAKIIESAGLYPILYPDQWDSVNHKWKTSPSPNGVDLRNSTPGNLLLRFGETNNVDNLLIIGYLSKDPAIPPKMISGIMKGLSHYLRERDQGSLKSKISVINTRLQSTREPLLKATLANELIRLSYDEARLNDEYYGFFIIDDPLPSKKLTPEQAETLMKQFPEQGSLGLRSPGEPSTLKKRNKPVILLLMALASCATAVFLAFMIEFFNKQRKENPEKYSRLQKYLSFSNKQ